MTRHFHQDYTQTRPATTDELEALVSECYPVVRDQIDSLTREFILAARRKHGKQFTPAVARETILKLIAATGGEILEMTL